MRATRPVLIGTMIFALAACSREQETPPPPGPPSDVPSVSIAPYPLQVTINQTDTVRAIVSHVSDATGVDWQVSDTLIASVTPIETYRALVTGRRVGSATLLARVRSSQNITGAVVLSVRSP